MDGHMLMLVFSRRGSTSGNKLKMTLGLPVYVPPPPPPPHVCGAME